METTSIEEGGCRAVSTALFTALFAGQAALIAMSPVLTDAASDLDVSTAAAGQLRTITGLTAGITALLLGRLAGRVGLGRQLVGASFLLALGSLASAAAPSFALLVAAQVPVGVAVAVLTTAGTLAAAEWVAPEARARTLSWALIGQPASLIVGMPLIGLVGEHSWRFGWLVMPLVGAVAAAALIAPRRGGKPAVTRPVRARSALADPVLARWLASELLANSAWAGTLVFAGALYAESYGTAPGVTGCLLALAAVANVAGNLACRRLTRYAARDVLIVFTLALAVVHGLFGMLRPHPGLSTAFLSAAAFAAGGRTLISSTFALATPSAVRPAVMSLRASTMQFGYCIGSIAGGIALALGGFRALGATMGLVFFGAAVTLAYQPASQRSRGRRSRLVLSGA